jgi:hypothetical protein
MGIVVLNNPQNTTWVQGSSYLGWDNAFLRSNATVSSSTADSGYPETNATSWLITGGGWRVTPATGGTTIYLNLVLAAAESLNSYGIYKHNLGTLGATVKLQYSSDGITYSDLTGSEKIVAEDKAIFFIGPNQTAVYWRLHITGVAAGATMRIGQAFISNSLRMFSPPEPGFTPPELALNSKYISNRADGGDFLGRSLVRRGSKMEFTNSIVSKDWVRSNWKDVMRAIEKTPFYYAWDSSNYPDEVAYCYIDKKISIPKYVNSGYMSLDLKFIALVE